MARSKQRVGAFRIVAHIVRPLLMVFTRRQWAGTERVPPAGEGLVVAANHISHLDPLTLAHFFWDNGRATRYLAKESLFRIPVIGRIISSCGQIPVYRGTGDAAQAYRAAVQAVRDGECVTIYPEGTISRDPQLWPMVGKTGAARVALETGCSVLPVAQWGVQTILAPYSKRPRLLPRKTVHVRAGAPVDLGDLRDKPVTSAVLREATDRIMAAVTAELEAIRGEAAPAERFDMRAAEESPEGGDSGPDEGPTGSGEESR
ncbi:lysophospholipid acyltransferase family protein [Phytoactinopolyspora halotolerans]|uniref:lysophospholipid acyltransferase family protein n=1 Tax=Phytoactinopolyspora halotolerans TaxID=1981512 RepID=UPI001C203E86|nr:lysophospholipid acyltransferase family protein [Phytoactinopolyspora halotolerans]